MEEFQDVTGDKGILKKILKNGDGEICPKINQRVESY